MKFKLPQWAKNMLYVACIPLLPVVVVVALVGFNVSLFYHIIKWGFEE